MNSEQNNKIPLINGLVLAGGKSVRMGSPKEQLDWHGKEHRYFVADLLDTCCKEVFISCRADQLENFNTRYNVLTDTFSNIGPLGGILSALHAHQDKAWLVVACDLPLLDEKTIKRLITCRDPEKIATTYKNPFDDLPEPLITIWEPKSYPLLLHYLTNGTTSLRTALIHSDILILEPHDAQVLMNVNTLEEVQKAKEVLNKK